VNRKRKRTTQRRRNKEGYWVSPPTYLPTRGDERRQKKHPPLERKEKDKAPTRFQGGGKKNHNEKRKRSANRLTKQVRRSLKSYEGKAHIELSSSARALATAAKEDRQLALRFAVGGKRATNLPVILSEGRQVRRYHQSRNYRTL